MIWDVTCVLGDSRLTGSLGLCAKFLLSTLISGSVISKILLDITDRLRIYGEHHILG